MNLSFTLTFLFSSWTEQSLQHADMWIVAEDFSTALSSVARDYWSVTTHRAGNVLQQELYKNSKAVPLGKQKIKKKELE